MTTTPDHDAPAHGCLLADCAARDAEGSIRLRGGTGTLVAGPLHTAEDVRGWFDRSKPGRYREQYRAALRLLAREACPIPELPPVHADEVPDLQRRLQQSEAERRQLQHLVHDMEGEREDTRQHAEYRNTRIRALERQLARAKALADEGAAALEPINPGALAAAMAPRLADEL